MKFEILLNIIRSIINFTFKIFSLLLFRFYKKQITFLFHGYSSSNILPVLEKLQEEISSEFKLKVFDLSENLSKGLMEKLKWNLYK